MRNSAGPAAKDRNSNTERHSMQSSHDWMNIKQGRIERQQALPLRLKENRGWLLLNNVIEPLCDRSTVEKETDEIIENRASQKACLKGFSPILPV